MKARKWVAWKLVQLAHRIYDPEWYESLIIQPPSGKALKIEIIGDEYGCGISSTSGIHWQVGEAGETAEVQGWKFTWPHAVQHHEYQWQQRINELRDYYDDTTDQSQAIAEAE